MKVSNLALEPDVQQFMSQISRKRSQKTSESGVVGFKMDGADRAKLNEQADALGMSEHLLARDFVLRAMNEQMDLAGALVTLNQQIFALREEMALVVEVLLSDAGKLSRDQAKKWADGNIKPA